MKNIIYILTLIILNSCANLTSLQDGRTLKKGEIEIAPFVSVGKFKDNLPDGKVQNDDENYYAPLLGLRTRFGIAKNFDGGIVIDMSTNFGLASKYQFIGNIESKFNSSIGLDFGVNTFGILFDRFIYYYSVPLYLSYNPNKIFTVFVTPRFMNNSEYVFREQYSKESTGKKYNINKFKISYGFLFGKKNKIGIEITNNLDKISTPTHLSIGYNVKL
jgi:hypothetical protein